MTERMASTTNYINDFSNTSLPMTSTIVTPTNSVSEIVTPSNFISETKTLNTIGQILTSFYDSEISKTFIPMSSLNNIEFINSSEMINIHTSLGSSILLTTNDFRTETLLSITNSTTDLLISHLLLSSSEDSFAFFNKSTSQNNYVDSQTFIETSYPENSDINSNLVINIPDVFSETSLPTTQLSVFLLTSDSDSIVKFYSTPLRTIAVQSPANQIIGSTFNFSVETIYKLTYHTRIDGLITSYTLNSGVIPETESTNSEWYFRRKDTFWTNDKHGMSGTVQKATHSSIYSAFSTQTVKTKDTILSTDTVISTSDSIYVHMSRKMFSSILQTYYHESTALGYIKQPLSSETSKYLSTSSFSDLTLRTSFFESSIYTYGKDDNTIATKRENSLMPLFADESISRTTESRMFVSGYLLSSFKPTEKDFSSRATEFFVTTTPTTNLYLVSSTKQNLLSMNSYIRTTDIMAFATKSSMYSLQNNEIQTIQNYSLIKTTVQQSVLGSAQVTSTPEWDSLASYHPFTRTAAVNSFITAQSTLQSSNISLIDNSDIPKVLVSASVRDASSVGFIPKTVVTTNNTKAGLKETTKNAIFITTVSVVAVIIITVSSIMLLKWVEWKKNNTTLKRKTDNASLSNDTQSVRKIFPEFPYMEGSIYPRVCSTVSSTYMTSPYEQNWNKV